MSQVIDERVVQMSFDNHDLKKGVKDTGKTLNNFDKELANVGNSSGSDLSKLTGAVTGISSKFSVLGTIATGALLNIGAKAVELGQKLISSIAIDPIMQGYDEYELKINSIKTMLASGKTAEGLPVTLDMVNTELAKLNDYSDKTIYSFADMTQNIGKFTNAGVDLESSVQAIKGIANAAALSGANSNEASRAMYNFAQALSAGYVKLIDWKSIENANMATVEFKQQLIDAAVAAGTLEQAEDGMYKVLTANSKDPVYINATKNFNDALQHQWLTTQVLTDTLTDYADETKEIGKKATEAATKVRTLSQLMDTTKEAVGSGWATSFELIVGDYDEATDLYTKLSDTIGGLVSASSDARNNLITDMIALGAREDIIDAVSTSWENLGRIFTVISARFSKVFGSDVPLSKYLTDVLSSVTNFVRSMNISILNMKHVGTIFEGIFSAIALGWKSIKFIFNVVKLVLKEILTFLPEDSGNKLLEFALSISKFFIELNKSTDKSNFFQVKLFKVLIAIKKFSYEIKKLIRIFKGSDFAEALPKALESIQKMFSGFKLPGGSSGGLKFDWLDKILTPIKNFIEKTKPLFQSAKETFIPVWEKIKEVLGGSFDSITFEMVMEMFGRLVNMLFAGGLLLGLKKLVDGFTGIADSTSGFLDGITGVLDGVRGSLKAYQSQLKSKALLQIAGAVGILAVSLIALAFIDSERLTKASLAITVLFANLAGSFALLEKSGGKGINLIALQLVAMATAIGLMTASLAALALIDPDGLKRGLLGIAALTATMSAFAISLSRVKGTKLLAASIAVNGIATGLAALTGVLALIGMIDEKTMYRGLTAIGIMLAEVVAFSLTLSKSTNSVDLLSASGSLIAIGYALSDITRVVSAMGNMDTKSLTQGLTGVSAALGVMITAIKLLATPNALLGAAAMVAMAASIAVFVPAIMALGQIPLEQIGVALLALVGVFTVIGIAAAVLGPMAPAILAVAGSVAILAASVFLVGAAFAAVGAGVALFAFGMATLAGIGAAGVVALTAVIGGLATLIPLILTQVAKGLIEFAKVVTEGAPVIAEMFIAIVDSWITMMIENGPKLIVAIGTLLGTILDYLVEELPGFVEAGYKILISFMQGMRDNIYQVSELALEILMEYMNVFSDHLPALIESGANLIIAYLTGIREQTPRLVDEAFETVIVFVNGFADAVRENTPRLIEAGVNLATAFIDGILEYLGVSNGESEAGKSVTAAVIEGMLVGLNPVLLIAKMVELAKDLIQSFKDVFGIKSPAQVMIALAKLVIEGLILGLTRNAFRATAGFEKLAEDAISALERTFENVYSIGQDVAEGLADGIKSKISEVLDAVKEMGERALETISWVWDINSPSKKFAKLAEYAGLGIIRTFSGMKSKVGESVENLAKSTLTTLEAALSGGKDVSATITPVVDMSSLTAGRIGDVRSQQSYALASSASAKERLNAVLQNRIEKDRSGDATTYETKIEIKELNVRKESDINAIAEKLKSLQDSAIRGRGNRTVYAT